MLEAIAEGWSVALTDEQVPEIVERLVAEMTSAANVERVLQRLGEPERQALAYVAANGQAKAHIVARKYGGLRHLGPGRLEWEQAWHQPASTVERLWFLGLLYEGYGLDEGYRGRVFFVPPEVLAVLPPMHIALPAFQVQTAPPPPIAHDDQDDLAHDVLVLLSYARNNELRGKRDILSARDLNRLGPRLAGERTPARLRFLQHLCQEARLIGLEGGAWKPTRVAANWLKGEALARRRVLFLAWLQDARWNELRLVPSVRCEGTSWRNDPIQARQGVLGYLRQCPVGSWWTIASFVSALHEVTPDFQRADGDYNSWRIRDVRTGQYLLGFDHWERVEGELIRYLLECPLSWLGVVALGGPKAGEPVDCCMLTPEGAATLGLQEVPASPRRPFVVQPDLQVIVPREASWYDRFLLERSARWVEERREFARYTLDRGAVLACVASGVSVEQILAFLQRVSAQRVPERVARILRAWSTANPPTS
jgi:hypothetical protein